MSLTAVFGMGTGGPSSLKTPTALNCSSKAFFVKVNLNHGDPYEIRTRVAGVRGRSLRPLDQRATIGTPSRARTVDTLIKSQVLYQLS